MLILTQKSQTNYLEVLLQVTIRDKAGFSKQMLSQFLFAKTHKLSTTIFEIPLTPNQD